MEPIIRCEKICIAIEETKELVDIYQSFPKLLHTLMRVFFIINQKQFLSILLVIELLLDLKYYGNDINVRVAEIQKLPPPARMGFAPPF